MSDQQSRQDDEPEPQQHDGRVGKPLGDLLILLITGLFLQVTCKIVMDLSEADWAHELFTGER
jgi:hypothetical protein